MQFVAYGGIGKENYQSSGCAGAAGSFVCLAAPTPLAYNGVADAKTESYTLSSIDAKGGNSVLTKLFLVMNKSGDAVYGPFFRPYYDGTHEAGNLCSASDTYAGSQLNADKTVTFKFHKDNPNDASQVHVGFPAFARKAHSGTCVDRSGTSASYTATAD